MPEVHPTDISPTGKPKKAKSGSPEKQHGENHSFTGWTNIDSLNASQIGQETQRSPKLAQVPPKPIEVLPKNPPEKEKPKETSPEPNLLQDLKRKLWIDVTRDRPYEESLRRYPKMVTDSYPKLSRVSSLNRVSTALNPHRNSEINVISVHYATTKSRQSPIGFPVSPKAQPQYYRVIKQNSTSVQTPQGGQNFEPIQSNSIPKTLDINTSTETPVSIKDFSLFRALALSPNPEKRAATAIRKRHSEAANLPITVIGVAKGIKTADTKKTKNLRLSKALSLWSQVASPAVLTTTIKEQPDEIAEVKNAYTLSLEKSESSTSGKNPGNPIPTKTLNFTGSTDKISGTEIKYLVPLPHFKPTIKVKRPADVEKSEAETRTFTNKIEAVKMRVTSPVNLYTRDWDTLNGFSRKVSREVGQKSEIKRRPFDEAYGDGHRFSETFNANTSLKSESKETESSEGNLFQKIQKIAERRSRIAAESLPRTKETSLERIQERLTTPKSQGFVKVIGKVGIDGKVAKRHERANSKETRSSIESPDSIKGSPEKIEKRSEANTKREVKNFRLF